MTRHLFTFLGTFVVGALIALGARAALFKPHTGHEGHPPAGGDYAPMVSNSLTPAKTARASAHEGHGPSSTPAAARPASDVHAQHGTSVAAKAAAPGSGQPVNTVCAICGMEVDPKLPMLEYQGRKIGFGCRMCAPKFKANPDKYGPIYLRNEVIKR